jgi:flagellar hook assembly protein FlgD
MMKKVFVLVVLALFSLNINAQCLNLFLKDGSVTDYLLTDIQKQTFTSTEMLIKKTDGNVLTFNLSDINKFTFGQSLTVIDQVKINKINTLIYPNPSNGEFKIDFNIDNKSKVDVSILNIEGKLIENIYSEEINGGNHSINWQNKSLSNGTYFIKIQNDNNSNIEKIVILK